MTRKTNPRAKTVLSLSALALLITGGILYAGALNPPAGPVTSTYKTLTEVEPRIAINLTNTPGDADSLFKITQPGSYYLTGNITGVVGKHGIEIATSGVTLDLMGFDLVGIPAMGAFDGVTVTASVPANIAVVNGSVRNWGDDGVDLVGSTGSINNRVERVLANGNAGNGIFVGTGSTVSNCTAANNTGNGIETLTTCTVVNCSAYSNTGHGISVNGGSTVSDCSAFQNTGSGINAFSECTVSNCTASANTGDGISVSRGSTVSNCSSSGNWANGIVADFGSTVEGCTARGNSLDGIQCSSDCMIRGNNCAFNGAGFGNGAGIRATGSDNRIEGNNCTDADRGIDVDSAGNIIIRNTCSGNTTDWDIAANNVFGPIIDRRFPDSAAVLGFSAASTLGSTDPNANFSY